MFEILDSTLREGEQCFGVFFPIEIKKKIALLLDRIGVDFIEVGHPAAAPSIRQAASEIARLNLKARLIAHARLDQDEIRAVKDLGLKWVGLFCGINGYAQRKYRLSKKEIFAKASEAVLAAKDLGLFVKFGCEDASRTDPEDVVEFYGHLFSLSVDRVSFADTLGQLTPERMTLVCARLKTEFSLSRIHFHLHDDSDLALRNAAAAVDGQAGCIDVSIMGIGERAGIVSFEKVLALARDRRLIDDSSYRLKMRSVKRAAVLVASCLNHERYSLRRCAHKSGIHINGVLKDPAAYEAADPSATGDERILVLSKFIGRSGLRKLLGSNGFQADKEIIDLMLTRVKADEMLELFEPSDIKAYLSKNGANLLSDGRDA